METQTVDWTSKCCKCRKEFCIGWKEVYPNGYWTHGHIDKNVATERQEYKGQDHEWYYCDSCYHVEHTDYCELTKLTKEKKVDASAPHGNKSRVSPLDESANKIGERRSDANNSCGCRHVFTCMWCNKIMSSNNEDTDHERACKNCINKIRALIAT